ncbi:unnamed protein product [Polarella glacialis]|uniref:Uncharacterized protein n=1 Tax=Polarella glacialis TaxID=89957 RepID=A0A813FVZ4_POLGL|nr:unnamed protein product [Polarella glacialis]CAE8636466.1 unnamed protein product [Polarella glacialis]
MPSNQASNEVVEATIVQGTVVAGSPASTVPGPTVIQATVVQSGVAPPGAAGYPPAPGVVVYGVPVYLGASGDVHQPGVVHGLPGPGSYAPGTTEGGHHGRRMIVVPGTSIRIEKVVVFRLLLAIIFPVIVMAWGIRQYMETGMATQLLLSAAACVLMLVDSSFSMYRRMRYLGYV